MPLAAPELVALPLPLPLPAAVGLLGLEPVPDAASERRDGQLPPGVAVAWTEVAEPLKSQASVLEAWDEAYWLMAQLSCCWGLHMP